MLETLYHLAYAKHKEASEVIDVGLSLKNRGEFITFFTAQSLLDIFFPELVDDPIFCKLLQKARACPDAGFSCSYVVAPHPETATSGLKQGPREIYSKTEQQRHSGSGTGCMACPGGFMVDS